MYSSDGLFKKKSVTQIFLVFVDIILNSISVVKAYLHDRVSPSWLPTLELGHKEAKTPAPDKVGERYKRASQRKHKKEVSDAVSSLLSLKKRRIDFRQHLMIVHPQMEEEEFFFYLSSETENELPF